RAERRPITLREAEQAYTDFEAHHQKLLDVAKQMLEACNIPLKEIGVWMDQNLNGAQGIGYRS
ncbi:MAG: hypothetical protein NXI01_08830, partial [Gammaproteobacteria bacterium]|nr:hypothetical protein [Gammaproteobacteria bacterium]